MGRAGSWLPDSRDYQSWCHIAAECGQFLTPLGCDVHDVSKLMLAYSGQGHGTFGPRAGIGLLMGSLGLDLYASRLQLACG